VFNNRRMNWKFDFSPDTRDMVGESLDVEDLERLSCSVANKMLGSPQNPRKWCAAKNCPNQA
jgi:hypothetical protein